MDDGDDDSDDVFNLIPPCLHRQHIVQPEVTYPLRTDPLETVPRPDHQDHQKQAYSLAAVRAWINFIQNNNSYLIVKDM